MSESVLSINASLRELANQIIQLDKKIILIFAFNCTGKTWLSMEYKNITKANNSNNHAGVYYNAYSEDLFYWDNDAENEGRDIKLNVIPSSLNQFHSSIDENKLREKLSIYKSKFNFVLKIYEDSSKGIEYIRFYLKTEEAKDDIDYIKISRGEEQVFIWCFFLTLFDIQGWTGQQNSHFFIDDPVSA